MNFIKKFFSDRNDFLIIIFSMPLYISAIGKYGFRIILALLISFIIGAGVEIAAFKIRKKEIGILGTPAWILFPLVLPPVFPLWMIGVCLFFGIVIGVAFFGGHGHTLTSPVALGWAFATLSFSHKRLVEFTYLVLKRYLEKMQGMSTGELFDFFEIGRAADCEVCSQPQKIPINKQAELSVTQLCSQSFNVSPGKLLKLDLDALAKRLDLDYTVNRRKRFLIVNVSEEIRVTIMPAGNVVVKGVASSGEATKLYRDMIGNGD